MTGFVFLGTSKAETHQDKNNEDFSLENVIDNNDR